MTLYALALVLAATPALSCPTAQDVAAGIVFTTDAGRIYLHEAQGAGIIAVTELPGPGVAERSSTLLHGVYPLASQSGARVIEYSYPEGLEALPYPALGASHRTELEFGLPGAVQQAGFSMAVSDTPVVTRLGTCDFETYGIATELRLPKDRAFESFIHWYPALATGALVAWTEAGEGRRHQKIIGVELR